MPKAEPGNNPEYIAWEVGLSELAIPISSDIDSFSSPAFLGWTHGNQPEALQPQKFNEIHQGQVSFFCKRPAIVNQRVRNRH